MAIVGEGLDAFTLASAYRDLLQELEAGRPAAMVTFLRTLEGDGRLPYKLPVRMDGVAMTAFPWIDDALKSEVRNAFACGAPRYLRGWAHGAVLIEPCFPAPTMIVLGGGHIAAHVVEMASKVGFLVTVIDDRPELMTKARFPSARRILCDDFDGCLDRLAPDSSAYVVILTRGHRYDIPCLRQALGRKLAYVGLMASKTRVAAVKDLLLREGFAAIDLERLHAPIGLEIGALTPEEIAVSIVAEAIRVRRKESPTQETRQAEFDRVVIEHLAERKRTAGVSPTKSRTRRNAACLW